jgi:hypothetical protein
MNVGIGGLVSFGNINIGRKIRILLDKTLEIICYRSG